MAELQQVLHEIVRQLGCRQELKDELHQAVEELAERPRAARRQEGEKPA